MSLIGALLILSGVCQAVECGAKAVGGTSFTVCRVDLNSDHLELFWRDDAGRPYRQFSALREALPVKGNTLVFAGNAGMYKPDLSPVGLFVVGSQELLAFNRYVWSGQFSP